MSVLARLRSLRIQNTSPCVNASDHVLRDNVLEDLELATVTVKIFGRKDEKRKAAKLQKLFPFISAL